MYFVSKESLNIPEYKLLFIGRVLQLLQNTLLWKISHFLSFIGSLFSILYWISIFYPLMVLYFLSFIGSLFSILYWISIFYLCSGLTYSKSLYVNSCKCTVHLTEYIGRELSSLGRLPFRNSKHGIFLWNGKEKKNYLNFLTLFYACLLGHSTVHVYRSQEIFRMSEANQKYFWTLQWKWVKRFSTYFLKTKFSDVYKQKKKRKIVKSN